MARPEWIEVGRISRAHGVRGEVRIVPDSDNPDRFAPGSVLYARSQRTGIAGQRQSGQVELTVDTVRGDEAFPIVAFREVTDRDAAEGLHGYVLEVHSTRLPQLEEGEFYPFDLQGLAVRDERGKDIGRVTDVIESPAHAILIVTLLAGREVMVPFVHAAVPSVALDQGFMVVSGGFLGEDIEGGVPG